MCPFAKSILTGALVVGINLWNRRLLFPNHSKIATLFEPLLTAASMADGIRWATDHSANIINLSLVLSGDDPSVHAVEIDDVENCPSPPGPVPVVGLGRQVQMA